MAAKRLASAADGHGPLKKHKPFPLETTGINALPDPVLEAIFEYAVHRSTYTQHACMLVCSRWDALLRAKYVFFESELYSISASTGDYYNMRQYESWATALDIAQALIPAISNYRQQAFTGLVTHRSLGQIGLGPFAHAVSLDHLDAVRLMWFRGEARTDPIALTMLVNTAAAHGSRHCLEWLLSSRYFAVIDVETAQRHTRRNNDLVCADILDKYIKRQQ